MPEPAKKLIEVALPLAAINRAAAREKSVRHGHPSTMHLWWSRKPLAICRAVLFASLVDDPSADPAAFPTAEAQTAERARLLTIIEELVAPDPATSARGQRAARAEIERACGGDPPPLLDPFAGGGSIPLEAQRLGLRVEASDLNPVAVLITRGLINLPVRFAGRPPVHPLARAPANPGGAAGLAADVRAYGRWMRDQAERRIGHLYPRVALAQGAGGEPVPAIAWLWARTVRCPSPACRAIIPLVRKWWLALRPTARCWVEPVIERPDARIRFAVRTGDGVPSPGTVGRHGATCLVCGTPAPFAHVRAEGQAGRLGARLLAVVAPGRRRRHYLAPTAEQEAAARVAVPSGAPDLPLPYNPRNFNTPLYGLDSFASLFTPRQLTALTTFSDLVAEAQARVRADALAAGWVADGVGVGDGGAGAGGYAGAVATYLAFAVDRCADAWSTLAGWRHTVEATRGTFARQALPMTWDYAEANPFGPGCGNWLDAGVEWIARALETLPADGTALVTQQDAARLSSAPDALVSTDPPYYDSIDHGNLSDYFYVWLRRSLGTNYPELCQTLLVPKADELVATPYRFRGRRPEARAHFERGLRAAFERLRAAQHPDYPLTLYYAFRQTERQAGDTADAETAGLAAAERRARGPRTSTGWEAMLASLVRAGLTITGTWPVRSERAARGVALGTNALTCSVVVVCRPRPATAAVATRRELVAALRRVLPTRVADLQRAGLAAVDLAQVAIGPGMAEYSRHSRVLDVDGQALGVGAALALINAELARCLDPHDAGLDADSRFCLAWYGEHAMGEGLYGQADVLARAKNTSLDRLVGSGLVWARRGRVRLRARDEYAAGAGGPRSAWETTLRLADGLERAGEAGAARLLAELDGEQRDAARALAYRLHALGEGHGSAGEARAYNALVVAWPTIDALAAGSPDR